ncbi:hypothetical protein BpHYR1_000251 [Brachionus plicatilis]|uniref:Uncharacterized protein n=1 Tax=Brachionus plicatilis TaxID=10195 RepID=A0A3M7R6N2_BRAPC|nr:hypothetical protein BpHYR1_000251 [Brachionus plicatilis]
MNKNQKNNSENGELITWKLAINFCVECIYFIFNFCVEEKSFCAERFEIVLNDKILNKSMIKLKNSIFLGAQLLSEPKYFSLASAKSSIILGNV